jgi:hypothetical protein
MGKIFWGQSSRSRAKVCWTNAGLPDKLWFANQNGNVLGKIQSVATQHPATGQPRTEIFYQLSLRNCGAGRPAALNRLQPSGKFTQA